MACVNSMENIFSNETYFLSMQGMRKSCDRCSTVSQMFCCDISVFLSGMAGKRGFEEVD